MCENIDVITIHQLLASYSNHFSVLCPWELRLISKYSNTTCGE